VITKNWFIHKVKKNSKSLRREVCIDDAIGELEQRHLSAYNPYLKFREEAEFWNHFWTEVTAWDDTKLKENERKTLDAIRILFERSEDLEIFNKKAIYLYMREITGLNTKQIVNSLNRLKIRYRAFKQNWDNSEF
jgi:hypothetical protein